MRKGLLETVFFSTREEADEFVKLHEKRLYGFTWSQGMYGVIICKPTRTKVYATKAERRTS